MTKYKRMHGKFYNEAWSYDENYEKGPVGLKNLSKPELPKQSLKYSFLGFPVSLPFGIPAGPLLNSKFIKAAFDFGFSVSTYKTVRADAFPCHPFPNVLYVDAPMQLHPDKTPRLIANSRTDKPFEKISITNSFGVPSKIPSVWQEDVRTALSYEKPGDLLILSFMGTVKKGQTEKEFIEDFALAARLANETGVKVLEANLSCPNIGNEGLVCYNLPVTKMVCQAIRKAIGNTKLVLKVGYYQNKHEIAELSKIANEYGDAIATINTLQTKIVDENGNQALPGKNRLRSGVCGASIKWAGIEMVNELDKQRYKNNYKYEIVGIGGVMTPDDFLQYRNAGADLIQSATAAMWNPYLASEIAKKLQTT